MSEDQNGSSRVTPSEPWVSALALVNSTWAASSSAIVMITKAWPRARSTTMPTSSATTSATRPPTGMNHSGLSPVFSASSAPV